MTDAELLRHLLDYDPVTGRFAWRNPKARRVKVGDRAGTVTDKGYVRIMFKGKKALAHILAVLYMTGEWPAGEVDHRNLNTSDNSWDNLRVVTGPQNRQSKGDYANNTSGFKGAYKSSKGRWSAKIRHGGKLKILGYFDSAQAAHTAYLEARARLNEFQPVPLTNRSKECRHGQVPAVGSSYWAQH